ncbi:MAG: NTP transferase domain-containing protein [Actinobacteria bacterium]|nr:NTP transferase domain-containing protein [Actinomycetota bacterium]MBW3649436.1 NTP transferase domain-containing protein [Actinomycetota bacterium]
MEPLAGVVLAAGLGTRLRPLTHLRPKALCPVGNVALVDLAIGHVRGVTGDVAVNVHAHRDQMLAHLGAAGVHLSVEEPQPLGTAGALGRLRDWIAGRPVLVHNADVWHRADVAGHLVAGWDGRRMRLLAVPAPPGAGDFGELVYAGVCLLPWAAVGNLAAEPSGLYEVLWRQADQEGNLDLVRYCGPWFDTGTPASYLAANLAASGGESVIAPDARVGDGAEVVRSVVWPGAEVQPGERLVEQIRAPGGVTVDACGDTWGK